MKATVKFFVDLAKVQAIVSRRFDRGLGGLGLNEFIILHHLERAENATMRRIDLAEQIGLTASGVTRILLPMEKVGLVRKEVNADDARVSLIALAPGGRRRLAEAMERAEFLADEIVPAEHRADMRRLGTTLADLAKNVR